MVASPTPKPTPADFPSLDGLALALRDGASVPEMALPPFAVALSGGADSTALLVACALRWPDQVHAIHINHGLQEAATLFEKHCVSLCQTWGVPLQIRRVNAHHQAGESPEEVARTARYQALSDVAHTAWQGQVRHIVLAQHADDQVETLLLALSRGAGLPGLASMPARMTRLGVDFHRPWLQVAGQTLRESLSAWGLPWVDDPSNHDMRYTRNRIRHWVLPALEKTFEGFRQTFVRSASHAAQAQTLLNELAQQDAQLVGVPPTIRNLQTLSPSRQTNVLRWWLMQEGMPASTAQMQALLVQVAACTTRGHQIHLKIGRGFVRRDGAVLRCYNT